MKIETVTQNICFLLTLGVISNMLPVFPYSCIILVWCLPRSPLWPRGSSERRARPPDALLVTWRSATEAPNLSGDDDAVKYYALIVVTERKTMLGALSLAGFSRFPKPGKQNTRERKPLWYLTYYWTLSLNYSRSITPHHRSQRTVTNTQSYTQYKKVLFTKFVLPFFKKRILCRRTCNPFARNDILHILLTTNRKCPPRGRKKFYYLYTRREETIILVFISILFLYYSGTE